MPVRKSRPPAHGLQSRRKTKEQQQRIRRSRHERRLRLIPKEYRYPLSTRQSWLSGYREGIWQKFLKLWKKEKEDRWQRIREQAEKAVDKAIEICDREVQILDSDREAKIPDSDQKPKIEPRGLFQAMFNRGGQR